MKSNPLLFLSPPQSHRLLRDYRKCTLFLIFLLRWLLALPRPVSVKDCEVECADKEKGSRWEQREQHPRATSTASALRMDTAKGASYPLELSSYSYLLAPSKGMAKKGRRFAST